MNTNSEFLYEIYPNFLEDYEILKDNSFKNARKNQAIRYVDKGNIRKRGLGTICDIDKKEGYAKIYNHQIKRCQKIYSRSFYIFCKKRHKKQAEFTKFLEEFMNNLDSNNTSVTKN